MVLSMAGYLRAVHAGISTPYHYLPTIPTSYTLLPFSYYLLYYRTYYLLHFLFTQYTFHSPTPFIFYSLYSFIPSTVYHYRYLFLTVYSLRLSLQLPIRFSFYGLLPYGLVMYGYLYGFLFYRYLVICIRFSFLLTLYNLYYTILQYYQCYLGLLSGYTSPVYGCLYSLLLRFTLRLSQAFTLGVRTKASNGHGDLVIQHTIPIKVMYPKYIKAIARYFIYCMFRCSIVAHLYLQMFLCKYHQIYQIVTDELGCNDV